MREEAGAVASRRSRATAAPRTAAELARVVVLAGGLTPERDVSLRSGRRVTDALQAAGQDAELIDADAALVANLAAHPPDAAFIALHGGAGEDGAVRGVLDLLGVPYVGATPSACRMAFDKPTAKAVVAGAGLRTPAAVALPHATFRELGATMVLEAIVDRLGLPLMVKPAQGGSALGAIKVPTADALPAAMVSCFSYGDTALIEAFVTGVEVAVSVVEQAGEPAALPAVEIVPVRGVFDYAARYTAGATEYYTPARLEPAVAQAAEEAALRAHAALSLRHLSRTDLIVRPDGTVNFLEVNVAPGMTETSLFPMAVAAAGLDVGQVCRDLLAAAVRG